MRALLMTAWLSAAAVPLILGVETAALAQPTLPPATDPGTPTTLRGEPERRWYGWQIILTDAAALAPVALISNGGDWGALALGLYLGGGPVVHGAHESGAKAAGSLGLRIVGVLGGALVGLGISADEHPSCYCSLVIGTEVGLVAGSLVASVVDVAVLAYDVQPTGSHTQAESLRLHLAPVAALPRDSTGHVAPTFGLVGSF